VETSESSGRHLLLFLASLCAAAVVVAVVANDAHPARRAPITLNLYSYVILEPGYDGLIPNFEHAYPNVAISPTFAPTVAALYQLTTTELAAGNGPDLIPTNPGCGSPVSICVLAKASYLAPLLKQPWTKWSLPLLTSASKYGRGLYAFIPTVSFEGIFTNDALFKEFGLKVPVTFSQLLETCKKARADGTIPLLLPVEGSTVVQHLLEDIALTTVYKPDRHWTKDLKAGTVSFGGTPGWHAALQELVDMDGAGCFEPGAAATTSAAADAEFAQGKALMYFNVTSHKGTIDAANPQFPYSTHPFPSANSPSGTTTQIEAANGVAVNAHASAQNQVAAQMFIDFLARPAQDALFARLIGSVTQFDFLHDQLPTYLANFAPVVKAHEYALNPELGWWNPSVAAALNQDGGGLITGQTSIDQVLTAMDAAWKLGPE